MKKKTKTFADFKCWLNDKGVIKLPPGISMGGAVDIIEGVEIAKKKYKKLMDYQK